MIKGEILYKDRNEKERKKKIKEFLEIFKNSNK